MNQGKINATKWTGKDQLISLGDSIYIRVRKSSKAYLIRKMINGKNSVMKLGKHPAMNLREARKAAVLAETTRERVKVAELVEEYLRDVVRPTSKVPNQVEGYLRHIDVEIGCKFIADIKRRTLVELIQTYRGGEYPRAADRLRSYLKGLFSYAVELGYIDASPMSDVSKRVTGYRATARKRVLEPDETRMVWKWESDNARLIQFLLLTGLRISEAQSGYIDGSKFRIDDTKGKHGKDETRPHWVHLTDTARALLPLPDSTATNIQAWLRRILNKEGIAERFTPHDCRRTFVTLANDAGVSPYIVERTIGHTLQGMMAVYNQADYEAERIECAATVERVILKTLEG